MSRPIQTRKRPCPSCPYRRDCPSGLWSPDEYAKLPLYDGEGPEVTGQQALNGATGPFLCHTTPARLCAGWVATCDMVNNFGLRMMAIVTRRPVDPAVYSYTSPVPLFGSGAEAAGHGLRDLAAPGPRARLVMAAFVRREAARDERARRNH